MKLQVGGYYGVYIFNYLYVLSFYAYEKKYAYVATKFL